MADWALSSSHHSLVYLFWGMLFIVLAFLWIVVQALGVNIFNSDYLYPLILMLVGATAIATALVWHRLTKS